MKKKLIIILIITLCSFILYGIWRSNQISPVQKEVLQRVLELVKKTDKAVVIFDLDGTLFDTRPREIQILKRYGFEKNIPKLKEINIDHITSWDLKKNLIENLKMPEKEVLQIYDDLKLFWRKHFFSNEYLKYDKALEGASNYVNLLWENGAIIVYLSGRDIKSMKEGTIETLKLNNFPIEKERVYLIMQADNKKDYLFKQDEIPNIKKLGRIVAYFENEPKNINALFDAINDNESMAVFLETDHSLDKTEPYHQIPHIWGYLME